MQLRIEHFALLIPKRVSLFQDRRPGASLRVVRPSAPFWRLCPLSFNGARFQC